MNPITAKTVLKFITDRSPEPVSLYSLERYFLATEKRQVERIVQTLHKLRKTEKIATVTFTNYPSLAGLDYLRNIMNVNGLDTAFVLTADAKKVQAYLDAE